MFGIIHGRVTLGITTLRPSSVKPTITALKDVNFWIVYPRINGVVEQAVSRPEMLGESRGSFGAKFTMEYKDYWLAIFKLPTSTGSRQTFAVGVNSIGFRKKQFVKGVHGLHIDCAGNVTTVVLIIEPAIEDMIALDLV